MSKAAARRAGKGARGQFLAPAPAPVTIKIKPWSARRLLLAMQRAGTRADFIHVDAPWMYSGGKNNTQRGLAGFHYEGMSELDIAVDMVLASQVAAPNCYMAFWTTFPKLFEWARYDDMMRAAGWGYITGGVWAKSNKLGAGYHLRGDAELILLYKRGSPSVQYKDQSDLWMLETPPTLMWAAERGGHSRKPIPILRDLVQVFCPPGGLVLDLYTGDDATMPRACRSLPDPHPCLGCELDEERWRSSIRALAQQDLFAGAEYGGDLALIGQFRQMTLDLNQDEEEPGDEEPGDGGDVASRPAGSGPGGGNASPGAAGVPEVPDHPVYPAGRAGPALAEVRAGAY